MNDMTSRTRHVFVVKEYVDEKDEAQRWLMLQVLDKGELSVLGKGFLGLDLRPGTSMEEAQHLADALNGLVAATSYTDPHAEAERINREQEEYRKRKADGTLN